MKMDGGKFFGAYRAFSGIRDAVVLNHVPVGCNWGAGMFRTISDQADVRQACTVMHEREIVFGGEVSLRRALLRADELYDAPLFLVVAGDVPSIIGDDVAGIVDELSLEKEVLWTEAAGFSGSMRSGYEEALLRLAPLMSECDTADGSINLIGFCPDDFKVESDVKEIKRSMKRAGIEVNCIISNCSFEEFKKAPAAELNVVFGQGTDLAKLMKEDFGVPYAELDYPYGIEGTEKFIESVSESLGTGWDADVENEIEPFKKVYLYLHELFKTPVSIIGDFRAGPLAEFLAAELGFEVEHLCSSGSDLDRQRFEREVRGSNTMMIFGSSFERDLARELEVPLVRFNYPVFDQVSIYDNAPYAGFGGAAFLTEIIINAIMGFGDF
jgi:nitrogenase molybdenum-iron protein alpha/beta subunit